MSTPALPFQIIPFPCDQPESFFKLIDKNKDRLAHSFPGTLAQNLSLEDTKKYCQNTNKKMQEKSYLPFLIINNTNGKFLGMIDLKKINWKIPKAEIGYFIDVDFEGKGNTSAALGLFLETIVKDLGFKKINARVYTENIGSQKVATKNGFELEGKIRKDHITMDGEVVDILFFGKVID